MRVTLIIDAGYLVWLQKTLGHMDLLKVKELVTRSYGEITKAYYVTSIGLEASFSNWLMHNGFEVVQKYTKDKECKKCGNKTKVEKGVDVYISVLMIKGALSDSYDRVALINGDADLMDALKLLMNHFKKEVYSIGWGYTMSQEIRTNVTAFLDLGIYIEGIAKTGN